MPEQTPGSTLHVLSDVNALRYGPAATAAPEAAAEALSVEGAVSAVVDGEDEHEDADDAAAVEEEVAAAAAAAMLKAHGIVEAAEAAQQQAGHAAALQRTGTAVDVVDVARDQQRMSGVVGCLD